MDNIKQITYLYALICIFIVSFFSCNENNGASKNNITDNETVRQVFIPKYVRGNCYSISTIEKPILYIGIPNILEFSQGLVDSASIIMKGAKVKIFKSKNICEIYVTKESNEELMLFKKKTNEDSILVSRKQFRIRELPQPETNFSKYSEIEVGMILAMKEMRCFIPNIPIEVFCETVCFSIVANINNKEVIAISDSNKFSMAQIDLLQKVKKNHHIIFKNIIVKLPDGTKRKLPSYAIKII